MKVYLIAAVFLYSLTVKAAFKTCLEIALQTQEPNADVVKIVSNAMTRLTEVEVLGMSESLGLQLKAETVRNIVQRSTGRDLDNSVQALKEAFSRSSFADAIGGLKSLTIQYIAHLQRSIVDAANNPAKIDVVEKVLSDVDLRRVIDGALIRSDHAGNDFKVVLKSLDQSLYSARSRLRYPLISEKEVPEILNLAEDSLRKMANDIATSKDVQHEDLEVFLGIMCNQGILWHAMSSQPKQYLTLLLVYKSLVPKFPNMI